MLFITTHAAGPLERNHQPKPNYIEFESRIELED